MNLRARIDAAAMTPYQWMVVALCVLLNCLDGFDVMAMAFTASSLTEEFALSGSQLGVLLSAGLVGMAVGSLALAPVADVIGRRPLILISVGLATVGMLLSAAAPSALLLGLARVVTGLGVGGILASTNVIASEYASARWRGLAIGLYTAGYGIGATLGGVAARAMLTDLGWRSVFVAGGVATGVALVLLVVLLPESVDFLVQRRPRQAVERINRILGRLGQPAITSDTLEATPRATTRLRSGNPGVLLGADLRRSTLLIWVAFLATMFGFYFVNSWTPQLLVTSGMSEADAVTAGMMLALGGTAGSVVYGLVASRLDSRLVLIGFTVLSALAMVVFITSTALLTVALVIGVLVGALINGCIAGLYTITPAVYGTEIRSTGMGWAIGIGRIGAILSPMLAGRLLDSSWTPVNLYVGAAVVVAISAVALVFLRTGQTARTVPDVASA
ncbi:MFS transporter [Nocardioides albus]|uniref:Benzoate transport n=1 Tax=Nocardioides albus TaxID=1841 RepID=A0A7W5FBE0_9ACTN|nr:MFS transporter [Nocardioides albus]MBB3092228.1 benzoate transport [Nocardioides albus]GGU46666.1 major facilitator superfamily permease [Nocardioides albus]